jgi:predicted phosphodiesterase
MGGERRTLILSDTHLGRSGALSPRALRPLWRGCERVVFNGDTAELQMPRVRAAAERAVDELRAMASADGVRLTLVCGNHDAHISDTQHLTLMDGRVLVMHGHALHPGIAPWTRAAGPMARMTRDGLVKTPAALADCLDHRLALARRVAFDGFGLDPTTHTERGIRPWDVISKPMDALRVLAFWRAVPGLAAGFLERYAPEARVIVMGHSHRQGLWRRGGRTVMNTGSFGFPGRPRAVVAEGQTLTMHDVRQAGGVCTLASRERCRVTLPARRTAPARPRERAA